MVTKHSIDLKRVNDPCYAMGKFGCTVLNERFEHCGTYKCHFYKPVNCKNWIRIEDRTGINLIPPEEFKSCYKLTKEAPY